jgi:hypothetical protein
MSLSVSDLRNLAGRAAVNAVGSSGDYDETDKDAAIYEALYDLIDRTSASRTRTSLTLTQASSALPALPTDFKGQYAIRAYIGSEDEGLDITDHTSLIAERKRCGGSASTAGGTPTMIAFDTDATGETFPTPDDAYVVLLDYKALIPSTYTLGSTASAVSTLTLSISDKWLLPAMRLGAAGYLIQNNGDRKGISGKLLSLWDDWLTKHADAGSLGGQVSFTSRMED